MKPPTLFLCICVLIVGVMSSGCKKDSPSEPTSTPTGPTGSLSFNSDSGSFSASGQYNPSAASGSGAGWLNSNTIAAYSIVSPTNISVAVLLFNSTAAGTYAFPTQVGLSWYFNVNPTDTANISARICTAIGGNAIIATNSGGITQGSFSGMGAFLQNPTQTMNITNGAFEVRSGTGKVAGSLPTEVDHIARKLLQKMIRE